MRLGVTRDLGADHAGRVAVVLGTAQPADTPVASISTLSAQVEGAVVRAGRMADPDVCGCRSWPISIAHFFPRRSRAPACLLDCYNRDRPFDPHGTRPVMKLPSRLPCRQFRRRAETRRVACIVEYLKRKDGSFRVIDTMPAWASTIWAPANRAGRANGRPALAG